MGSTEQCKGWLHQTFCLLGQGDRLSVVSAPKTSRKEDYFQPAFNSGKLSYINLQYEDEIKTVPQISNDYSGTSK